MTARKITRRLCLLAVAVVLGHGLLVMGRIVLLDWLGSSYGEIGIDRKLRVRHWRRDSDTRQVEFLSADEVAPGERVKLRVLNAGASMVRGCAFAPDGRRLASSHMDGSVRVWDLRSGFLVLALDGSMDKIAFGPSGRRLFGCPAHDAPAASGRRLYVWNAPAAGR